MVGQDELPLPFVPAIAEIPLKLFASADRILYASAIAYKLAAQRPVMPLAESIAAAWRDRLNQPDFWQVLPLPPASLPYLHIQVMPPGLIQITLPDRAIAPWLDSLMSPLSTPLPLTAATSLPFSLHHAHARCCSLLRLAHHQGLITLTDVNAHPNCWQMISPTPIVWLDFNQHLTLNQPSDRSLIAHLFSAVDLMQRSSPLNATTARRLATAIAQAFQDFHSTHPLFCQPPAPSLLVQCGLILGTQRVLHRLLTEALQATAAIEL